MEDKNDKINEILMNNAPVSIIIIDKNGYIVSANKYYREFARSENYKNHNVFTGNFFVREKLAEKYKKLLSDGTMFIKPRCHEINSRGEDKYLKIIAVPIRNRNGAVTEALSIGLDVTEVVAAKNKLDETNRNLENMVRLRTRAFNRANKKLAEVLNFKSALMADITHEIRTPLTIIMLCLDLLAKSKTQKKTDINEPLENIFSEIRRISDLLADLSSLADCYTAMQKINYEKINLDALVEKAVNSLKLEAQKRSISISYDSFLKIEMGGDRKMLEKLLLNLLANAIRYNKNGGWVRIKTEEKGDNVIITVKDNGLGIPRDELPNIFKRFYRVASAETTEIRGSGLGLAICKSVVEAHGGTISAESIIGCGSLFTVKLPKKI